MAYLSLTKKFIVVPLGSYALLNLEVLKDLLFHGVEFKELCRQIVKIGTNSIPIIVITAAFTGMVLALQTAYGLERFGAKNYVGNIVSLALVRELGPVLTALMMCSRVGAGIAAEIGSMVVTEQVDAIISLGANPIRKLVTPRIIAGMIVAPMLVVIADLIGIYGGILVATLELNISFHSYYHAVLYTVLIKDFIDGLIKSAFFGFLLVSIACYMGLRTSGGTEGVGITTTKATVVSSIAVFISDFFITKLLIILSANM